MSEKCAAIILAAGKGKRMNSDIAKQYLELDGKPVLYYSLNVFQKSFIDEIVVVAAEEDREYVKEQIVVGYGISKVSQVVTGGKERYHSVMCGLRALNRCDYVFIHDGARPFVDDEILARALDMARNKGTAVAAMPVKDTIKIIDDNGAAVQTPERSCVWQMQTPQVFLYNEIYSAYESMLKDEEELFKRGVKITDDAMVMEMYGKRKVYVSEGSYRNIKITTPEDMEIAKILL
ncbi:MAG: 2-C-methyl-D-erythritol 4-phosphate cytidylyltransferase [Lachnospiraceae bacterium]|nr:2-C-methyl-D-erythritol 4-phosphate cytidylyltransferase [Lachnospiraceae bacterium]